MDYQALRFVFLLNPFSAFFLSVPIPQEIRQLQQKQASYIREISDLQETIEWKDKKIGVGLPSLWDCAKGQSVCRCRNACVSVHVPSCDTGLVTRRMHSLTQAHSNSDLEVGARHGVGRRLVDTNWALCLCQASQRHPEMQGVEGTTGQVGRVRPLGFSVWWGLCLS